MTADGPLAALSTARPSLRSALFAPVRLQTYRNLLYLVLAIPLGLMYFVFLAIGMSVGVALLITVVGVPVLLLVLAAVTGLASIERKLTAFLLGVDIAPPEDNPIALGDDRSILERAKALLTRWGTWKALVYLASKLALGIAAFVAIMSLLVRSVSLLLIPFVYQQPYVVVGVSFDSPVIPTSLSFAWGNAVVGFHGASPVATWEVTTAAEATVAALAGVLLIVVALNLLNALAWLSGRYAKVMLGEEGFAPVREALS